MSDTNRFVAKKGLLLKPYDGIPTNEILMTTPEGYVVTGATISDLSNSAHTHSWSDINSTPTTISGYGITNAYTITETNDNFLSADTSYYTQDEANANFLTASTNLDFSSNFLSANTSFYTQSEVNDNFLSANTFIPDSSSFVSISGDTMIGNLFVPILSSSTINITGATIEKDGNGELVFKNNTGDFIFIDTGLPNAATTLKIEGNGSGGAKLVISDGGFGGQETTMSIINDILTWYLDGNGATFNDTFEVKSYHAVNHYWYKSGSTATDTFMFYDGENDILNIDARNGGITASTFYGNLDWSYITSKPTTISGYGIIDAYTKSEVYNTGETYTKVEVNGLISTSSGVTYLDFNTYTGVTAPSTFANLDDFNSHTGNTSNPHQTTFSNLTNTAHTHLISDVTNLQSTLNLKTDLSIFNSHTATTNAHNVTAALLGVYTSSQTNANFLSANTNLDFSGDFLSADTSYYTQNEVDTGFLSAETSLNELSDVDTTTVTQGQYLSYSAGTWVPVDDSTDLSNYYNKQESNANFLSANTNLDFSGDFLSANTSFYTQSEANENFLSANTSLFDGSYNSLSDVPDFDSQYLSASTTISDLDGYTKSESDSNYLSANTNLDFSGDFLSANTSFYTQQQANDNFLSANTSYYTQDEINSGFLSADTQYVDLTTDQNIGGEKTFTDDVVIHANLTVSGTTTTLNTEDLNIKDNIILLNSGETGSGISKGTAGIQIDRGTATDASLIFDDLVGDVWKAGLLGSEVEISLLGHTHSISDVTGLQTALDNKLDLTLFNTYSGITAPSSYLSANTNLDFSGDFLSANTSYYTQSQVDANFLTASTSLFDGSYTSLTDVPDFDSMYLSADTSYYTQEQVNTGFLSADTTIPTDYYTQAEANDKFVYVTGDTMIGNLSISSGGLDVTGDTTFSDGDITYQGTTRKYKDIVKVGYDMYGNAATYNGVICAAAGSVLIGNTYFMKSFDNVIEESAILTMNLPTDYDAGTDIKIELQVLTTVTTGGGVFVVGVENVNNGEVYDGSTDMEWVSGSFTAPGTTFERETITYTISGTTMLPKADVGIVIYRDTLNASDTIAADIFVSSIRILYISNKLGENI